MHFISLPSEIQKTGIQNVKETVLQSEILDTREVAYTQNQDQEKYLVHSPTAL